MPHNPNTITPHNVTLSLLPWLLVSIEGYIWYLLYSRGYGGWLVCVPGLILISITNSVVSVPAAVAVRFTD